MKTDKLLETLRTIAEHCRPFPIAKIAQDAIEEIEALRAAREPLPVRVRTSSAANDPRRRS